MLTLTFLGVGSAFAKRNFQSNALIEAWSAGPDKQRQPDDTLLIDFGATGPLTLHRLRGEPGFSYLDRGGAIRYSAIRRVFITHLHGDHIAGLEELASVSRFAGGDGKPFRPQLISSQEILSNLWDQSLRGGLGTLPGRPAAMEDYFSPCALYASGQGDPDRVTMLDRYEVSMAPTDHIRVQRKHDWPSFGVVLRDVSSGDTAFYSGDTRFDPAGLGELMTRARINFHEVQLADQPDPVHTLLSELRTLPATIRKKTILYHYDDNWDDPAFRFVADEFAGFATPHRRYELFA
ncbi:MAG: MBL fold metallo-hydrolase [Phycisphaerales bacterium]|nr:MBL fold metallo-hydrolase [Phycisphaerales bacterium]